MLATRRQIDRCRGAAQNAFEELRLQVKVSANWIGHQVGTPERIHRRLIAIPIDENQAFGLMHWQRAQDELVDERIHGRGGSDAQRQ